MKLPIADWRLPIVFATENPKPLNHQLAIGNQKSPIGNLMVCITRES